MNHLKSSPLSALHSMPIRKRPALNRWLILLSLMFMVVMVALPGYFSQRWPWQQAPKVEIYPQLLQMRSEGITLPNWPTTFQKEIRLDQLKWSVQTIQQDETRPIVIMLLPQGVDKEKPYVMWSRPYVEWTGIDGLEHWKKDRIETLTFETAPQRRVKARFFKAWNQQTFAVIQWYAWPGGGGTHSFDWFWRDLLAQLRGQRLPWVAVNVKIPIDPLSSLDAQAALAKSLAQKIQTALETDVFQMK